MKSSNVEKKTALAIAAMRCIATSLPFPQNYDRRAMYQEWHFLNTISQVVVYAIACIQTYFFLVLPRFTDTWGGLAFNLCRMQHVDRVLIESLQDDKMEQVVFLGVGADCRSTRYANLFDKANAKAYELDLPNMIRYKIDVVKNKIQAPTDHITYVPIDFSQTKVDDVLAGTTFDPKKATFFNWEGVTYYLTTDAIDQTMTSIAKLAAPGSTLTFDFLLQSVIDGSHPSEKAAKMMEAFKNTEPLLWGLNPDTLGTFLSKYGFEVVEHLSPQVLQNKYMLTPRGMPLMNVQDLFHIVTARKVK